MPEPIADGLVAFLGARYDELEATARAAAGHDPGRDRGRWEHLPGGLFACVVDADDPDWSVVSDTLDMILAHVALNDPRFVLDDVAAKRRILARHTPVEQWAGWNHIPAGQPGARQLLWLDCSTCIEDTSADPNEVRCTHGARRWPCPDVLDLVAPFAGHPDFDPAWRPA